MNLILCPECDQSIRSAPCDNPGLRASCPRCGFRLQFSHSDPQTIMALSLTGLLLCIPAFFNPLLRMNLLDRSHQDSLWGAVQALFSYQFYFVGTLIALCSIIFPALFLWLSFYISYCMVKGRRSVGLIFQAKLFQYLEEWVMLDIYFLAIVISIIKLADLAAIQPSVGFYSFIGLMLSCVILQRLLPLHSYWNTIENSLEDTVHAKNTKS